MKSFLPITIGSILLFGCSFGGPIREDRKAAAYEFGSPGSGWEELKLADLKLDEKESAADHIFSARRSGAVLSIGSLCDRYSDSSLESLTKDLINPLRDSEIENQERLIIDGREGLLTHAHGLLDGVTVAMRTFVIRKDDCIFDFTLNARGEVGRAEATDFERVFRGFRYRGGSR